MRASAPAAAAPRTFDWLLILWDRKDREVARERGDNVGALLDHAEAMVRERSAHDWELVDLRICRSLAGWDYVIA